jgi:hypothetical protein
MTKLSRKIKQTLDSSWSYSAPDTSPLWRVAMVEVWAEGFTPASWLLLPERHSVRPGESLKELSEKVRKEEGVRLVRIKVFVG